MAPSGVAIPPSAIAITEGATEYQLQVILSFMAPPCLLLLLPQSVGAGEGAGEENRSSRNPRSVKNSSGIALAKFGPFSFPGRKFAVSRGTAAGINFTQVGSHDSVTAFYMLRKNLHSNYPYRVTM